MKRHKIRKKRNPGWYFLLPEFLGVSVFGLIPFADVVRRSFFQTVDGSFVGISNYVQVIKNDAFNLAAKNTLRFVVTCIPCLLLLSLILAMLLQQVLILAEKKKKHRNVTMEQFLSQLSDEDLACLVRGEGRAVCRRLQNAVGAGEELLQVADGPQLHDAIRHTQRDAQHLAVCQSLLQDGTGVDLPPGGDEAEHRSGTAILRKRKRTDCNAPGWLSGGILRHRAP